MSIEYHAAHPTKVRQPRDPHPAAQNSPTMKPLNVEFSLQSRFNRGLTAKTSLTSIIISSPIPSLPCLFLSTGIKLRLRAFSFRLCSMYMLLFKFYPDPDPCSLCGALLSYYLPTPYLIPPLYAGILNRAYLTYETRLPRLHL